MGRILLFVMLCGCGAEGSPLEVSADQPLPPELRAGDVVHHGEISIEVPVPGEIVHLTVDREDGTSVELVIENSIDGVVSLIAPPVEPAVLAAGSADPCQDGAFKLAGHHWTTEYRWWLQAGSSPAANNKDNVETGLRHAANAIATSRNSCGLADQVSATMVYAGRTTQATNVRGTTTTVSCGTRDVTNVVGFGTLPSGYLAVACSWSGSDGVALEGDVKFNTRHRWFALAVPDGCSSSFGLQQVGAHEFGHVVGLAHVSQSNHPSLTMSPQAGPCSNAKLSLGLGDVRGLRALY